MLSRAVRREILSAHDPALPFRKVAGALTSADISFANLESPFSDRGPYHEDGLIFHAAPETIAGLDLAGIDVVSTANNHSRDCASHGVEFSIMWLRQHGIQPVGSGLTASEAHAGVILERRGIRFGFLAYTFDQQNGNWRDIDERIAVIDETALRRDIKALIPRCDVAIVSMHNGTEYAPLPNAHQIAFAHAAIDAGASLVIGHHPHVVQKLERYRGEYIFYSLGNFVFDQYERAATRRGEVGEVTFAGKNIIAVNSYFVDITTSGPEFERP